MVEHLAPADAASLATEAARVARRRVVVAVPDERVPTAAYGHHRVVGAGELTALGSVPGWRSTVHEHHGRWLVLER